jgi:fluoroacetyl-CoA thioesterase
VDTGLVARISLTVTDTDTALALGSGDVPVLGTPRLIALCEQAAALAVADSLTPEMTTVGMRVELAHLAPTAVGHVVEAEATLDRIEGKRLTFNVSVHDDRGLVAAGKVTRVVVNRQQFLDKSR